MAVSAGKKQQVSEGPPQPGFVVDTSVALKWFVEEQKADVLRARQLQDAYLEGRCILFAPGLLLFELANALKSGRRFKPSEVLTAVRFVLDLELRLWGFRLSTLTRAVEVAASCGVPVYDSYFLAMALESGSVLVTADDAFFIKPGTILILFHFANFGYPLELQLRHHD